MDPTSKPKGPSPHYSLYQREIFKRGGTEGKSTYPPRQKAKYTLIPVHVLVPHFSVHPDELGESTKKKLDDRAYFYANSNAGLGWTDRANR